MDEVQQTELFDNELADRHSDIQEFSDNVDFTSLQQSQDSLVKKPVHRETAMPESGSQAKELDHARDNKSDNGDANILREQDSDGELETSSQTNRMQGSCYVELPIIPVKHEDIISRILSPPPSPPPGNSSHFQTPSLPITQRSVPSFDGILSEASTISIPVPYNTPKALPHNTIPVRERKRIIVSSSRPTKVTKDMHQWYSNTSWLLDPFLDDNECWFHPSPPPARLTASGLLRPCGNISKHFRWNGDGKTHSLVLNFGIVVKLLYNSMTKQQQDGFINQQWHLSHLCGNWTCLNPRHTTVEPGAVNLSRNNCFSHRAGCLHTPPCLKELKMPLGTDGKIVDHSKATQSISRFGDVDDWATNTFVEEEEEMHMAAEQDEDLVHGAAFTQPISEAEEEVLTENVDTQADGDRPDIHDDCIARGGR